MDYEIMKSKNIDLTKFNVDNMDENSKQEIMQIKDSITFDYESVQHFGIEITKKLTDFSTQILDSVKVKDSPEIEGMLLGLVNELNKFNTNELTKKKKRGFLGKLFNTDKAENFVTRYKTISAVISDTKKKLEEAQYQLQKDIKTSESYLEMNKDYIMQLEKYIAAGDLKIEEEDAAINEQKKIIDTNDSFAVQELATREAELDAFKKKVYNLRLQRMIAIQNIPQLRLIKDGDAVLIEKIDDGITQAIPLWETQIVTSLQIGRQAAGAEITKSLSDTINSLYVQNAELLKQSAVSVAKENERGILDIESAVSVNNLIIDTINGVREARKEGEEQRNKAIAVLAKLQTGLNEALINVNT